MIRSQNIWGHLAPACKDSESKTKDNAVNVDFQHLRGLFSLKWTKKSRLFSFKTTKSAADDLCLHSGATTDNLPPGVLYQVKAAYKYQAEDMDELQFEVGEVIDVVEYEDPEEQVEVYPISDHETGLDS